MRDMRELMQHQLATAIAAPLLKSHCVGLFDEPGTGKTGSAIAVANAYWNLTRKPSRFYVPAYKTRDWEEFAAYCIEHPKAFGGIAKLSQLEFGDFLTIVDEAHLLSDINIRKLNRPGVLIITGTPSRVTEFFKPAYRFRRTYEDCGLVRPRVIHHVYRIDAGSVIDDTAFESVLASIASRKRNARINRKTFINEAIRKLHMAAEIIAGIEKPVIFVKHVDVAYETAKLLGIPYLRRNPGNESFVSTYGTLAQGVNLQHFRNVVLLELDYVPHTMIQAVHRIARYGSKGMAHIHWIVNVSSFDDRIAELAVAKC